MTLYPYGAPVLVWPNGQPPFVALAGVHGMLGNTPALEVKGDTMTLVVPLDWCMPLPARETVELWAHIQNGGRA